MPQAIRSVVHTKDEVGETPVWSPERKALYWIDVTRQRIHRWMPGASDVRSHAFDEEVGSIGLRRKGGLVAAMRTGFYLVDEDGRRTALGNPEPGMAGNCLNDGRCDRQGRFWAGSAWFGTGAAGETAPADPTAALYCLEPGGAIRRALDGLFETNTVAWSPDDRSMYVGDSRRGEIYVCDFDAKAGTLANRRLFVVTKAGDRFHDGSVVDAEGFLWATIWNGWRVVRYAPDGRVDREIELPVQRPTACSFGGEDMTTLYVTTATWGLKPDELARQPMAGGVLAVETGVRGLLEASFAG